MVVGWLQCWWLDSRHPVSICVPSGLTVRMWMGDCNVMAWWLQHLFVYWYDRQVPSFILSVYKQIMSHEKRNRKPKLVLDNLTKLPHRLCFNWDSFYFSFAVPNLLLSTVSEFFTEWFPFSSLFIFFHFPSFYLLYPLFPLYTIDLYIIYSCGFKFLVNLFQTIQ